MASATPTGNDTTEPLSALTMATVAPTNGKIAKSTPMIGELAEPGDPEETAVGSMGNKIDPGHQVENFDATSSSKEYGDLEPEFEAAAASHVDDHDPVQQKHQGHINQPMSAKNEQQEQEQQHPQNNHHTKSHHYRRYQSRSPTGQTDPFSSGHQEQYSTHPSAQRHHKSNPQSKSRILNSSLQPVKRNNKRRHSSITPQNIHLENENEAHALKRNFEKSNDPLATKSPSNTNGNFISSGKKASQRRTRSHRNQRRHEIASWFVVPRLDVCVEGGEVNPSVKTVEADINMSIDNPDSKNDDGGKKRMAETTILEGEMEATEKEAKRSAISNTADKENARHFNLNTRTVDNISKIRNQNPTHAEENQESKGAPTSTPHTKPKETETQPPFEEMTSTTVAKSARTLHRQEKNDHSTYPHHDRNSDSQEKVATGESFANLNTLSEGENWVVCSFYDYWGSAHDITDKRSGVKENSVIVNDDKSAYAHANAIDRATTPIATEENATSQRLSFHQQPLHLSIVKSHRNLYVEGGRVKGRTLPPPTSRIGCAPTGVAPKVSDHFFKNDDSNVEGIGSIERDDIKMSPLEKGGKTDAEGVRFVSKREVNAINGEFAAKKQKMFGSGIAVLCIDVDYDGNFVAVKDIRNGLTPAMQQQHHHQHQHMQSQQLQNQELESLPLNTSGRISENHNESHDSKREFREMQLAEELEIFLVRRKPVHKQKLQYHPPTEAMPNALGVDATTDTLELETSKHYSEDDLLPSGSDSNEDSLHNNGYDTDDEKEGDDVMEELNERSAEVRFCENVTPMLERSEGGAFNMAEGGLKGRSHSRKPLVHFRPPPPREEDVDDEGHLLYYGPEPLPRRQLRVLREGDRILMRYWPLRCSDQCGRKEPLHEYPCVAKFEYIYGRHYHKNPLPRKSKDSITQATGMSISPQVPSPVAAATSDLNPAVLATAPRLRSVKSDVKSEEKKQFTLNSTSAAEAPTDGNLSVNAKKAVHTNKTKKVVDRHHHNHQHHHHHHQNCHNGEDLLHGPGDDVAEADAVGRKAVIKDWAGKDWSAVESEIDGVEGFGGGDGDGEKGGTATNIGQNDVDDDDDGMEEYSYLTGEVVIKDQDYISAITGDDATMPSAMVLEYGDEGEYEQVPYDGEDAATASAVVLGAATSPSKSAVVAGRTLRGLRDGEKKDAERHDDFFRTGSCAPKRATSKAHISEGHISRSSGRKPCYRSEKLVVEAVVRAPEVNELEPFFTPASREHDSDETGVRSEDELLSQPADNESSQKLGGAKTAPRERISGNGNSETDVRVTAEKMNDSSIDVEEDVSLTQPFPIPDNIKLSHGGNDPDDNTTDVSLTQPVPKCVSTNAEVKLSQQSLSTDGEEKDNRFAEPPNLVAAPDKSEHPDGENGCPDNNCYDETTQDFMIPEISNMHSKDEEEFQVDTQFELPPAFAAAVDFSQHDNKIVHTENTTERNHDDDEPVEHGKTGIVKDKRPSAELKVEPAIDTETGIIQGLKLDDEKGVDTQLAPKTKSSTKLAKLNPSDSHEESQNEMRSRQISGRRAAPDEAYNDSALQTQRAQNSAVHRVWSGAIMTGPVGGASLDIGRGVGSSSPSAPNPGMRRAEKDLLTSIALLSNDPNPNPLPDAAASSEETTVCQMDDADLAKEQGSNANGPKDIMVAVDAVERKTTRVERNDTRVGREECFRDPDIPTEVSFVDKGRGRYGRHSNESLSTLHHRSTRRQREVLFSELRPDTENEKIRVIFTGITPTSRHKRMIDSIGAELVESVEEAASATHVIVSDGKSKLRRTPKLMICISKVSKILSIDWLVRSAMEKKILDTDNFLLLEDKEAEKTYNFSMKQTIENGITARRERGGVLGGWSVYICANVAGNRAPSTRELILIIHAAGGKSIDSLSHANVTDPSKLIILTSDPGTNAQLKEDGVEKVERLGAKVATTTWLFHTIITQKLSHDYDGAGTPRRCNTDSFIPQSGKPRAKRKLSERNMSPNHGKRRRSTRKQG